MVVQVSSLSFNRGLDEIIRDEGVHTVLPRGNQIAPGRKMIPSPIAEAVTPRSLDDFIAEHFEPQLTDGSVLIPANFRKMASAAASALLQKARTSPQNRERLMDASDILTTFSADLTDLDQRRGALLHG